MLKISRGDTNGAGNGPFASRGVSFQYSAIKAQKRSAAISFRIHFPFDGAKGILGKQRAKLPMRTGGQFALEHRENTNRQTFASFQNNVADESVADNNLDSALKQIVSFNVAYKIEVKPFAQLESLKSKFVPFGFLSSDT